MPNPIKYSTGSESDTLKKGNLYIGTGSVGKGPSDTTGYYQGPSVPSGGYVIYMNKVGAPGGLSYHSAANDTELISFTNNLAGQSYTGVNQCFDYYYGQNDKVLVNQDYPADYPYIVMDGLVFYLDAGLSQSYPESGTVWTDVNGLGPKNNGTLINGPTFSTDGGGSIAFDGTNDYGTLPTNLFGVANNTNISALTIDVWVNWNNFPTNDIDEFISWWAGGSSTVGFLGTTCTNNGGGTNTNPSIRFGDGWQNTGVKFTASTDTNKWWNITAVKSSNNAYIYRNGNLETTRGSSMNFTVDKPPAIGCHDGSVRIEFFDGKIAIIRIYNRDLTSTEILQNFNATKGRFGL